MVRRSRKTQWSRSRCSNCASNFGATRTTLGDDRRLPRSPGTRVAIRTSSAKEIDGLIADLASDRALAREAAIARLAVIGPRAVDRLVSLIDQPTGGAASRVAALRALEGLGDVRALDPALRAATSTDADVAAAGVAVIRTFVSGRHGVAAVDGLTAISMNPAASETIRLEAIEALGDLDAATL